MGSTGVSIRIKSRSTSQETATGRSDNATRASRGGIFTGNANILGATGSIPREITDGQGNGVVISRLGVSQDTWRKAISDWTGKSATTKTNSNATYRKAYTAAIKRGLTPRQATAVAQMARNQREATAFVAHLSRHGIRSQTKTRKGTR